MELNWSRNQGVLVAKPEGRVYSSNYLEWQSALEAGIGPDDVALVVDFEQVPYLSSAGLRVLMTMARQFDGPGHAFAISNPTRGVRKVLAASGFDRIIAIHESEAAAVAAINGEV